MDCFRRRFQSTWDKSGHRGHRCQIQIQIVKGQLACHILGFSGGCSFIGPTR